MRGHQALLTGLLAYATVAGTVLAEAPPPAAALQPAAQQPPADGRALYDMGCAACHGIDGGGTPREGIVFDIELPDFTDCSFATREPDEDWLAVTHDGGPARAFDQMMPAFGEAFTEDELLRILGHIRTFCSDDAWPRGELNLPRALVTEKAYPEDEAVLTTSVNTSGAGAVLNEIVYERRFGARNHVEVAVPFGALEGDANGWSGGIGDVALGVKRVLFHSLDAGTIISAIGEVVLPTGSERRGFGRGVTVFEPSIAYGQILAADAFLQVQGGLEIPTDRDRADREAFWRAVIGRTFTQGRFGRAWSPMIEVVGVRDLRAGGDASWDLLPQMQVTLPTRQHVMVNAGVRFPVGDRRGRPTTLMVYLLWDWFDGGFFEGWR